MRQKINRASCVRYAIEDWFFNAREIAWLVLLIGGGTFVALLMG